MLCNPVVWKVTLLLRYLKLQRITAVQFVYCFRKKKTSFLGALCYLRSQPHARWTSTLWLLCGTVRIPVSSSCLVVPLTAPLLIIPFFFFFFSSQYGAEFRRFSVDRVKPGKFEEFYKLILHIHRIANMEVMIGYADVHGDLLPINNDDNFVKAVSTAHPLLRIFIQRQGKLIYTVRFPSPLYPPQITSLILV